MRTTTHVAIVLAVSLSAVGCKTAPKLAWWKSDTEAAESTAIAHSAPDLPSEVAKQLEGLEGSQPALAAAEPGGEAPPYVASVTPSEESATPFPVTSAPAFNNAAQTAAAAIRPYDPTMVASAAPAEQVASTATSEAPSYDYGSESADRYGLSSQYAASPSPEYDTASPAPNAGDRYGQSAPAPVSAETVATATPYRPGGTSTYPASYSTEPSVSVATRPQEGMSQDTIPAVSAEPVYR